MKPRSFVLGFGAFGSVLAGTLVGYELFAPSHEQPGDRSPAKHGFRFDARRSLQRFSQGAESYDRAIDREELFSGIKLLRWYLIRNYVTGGNALEVSAGTGRNLKYYRGTNVTLADSNRDMLVEAAAKARDAEGEIAPVIDVWLADSQDLVEDSKHAAVAARLPTEITRTVSQAEQSLRNLRSLRKFPPDSFDTVVDSFGLCSLADPRKALEQMVRVARPGGRIILIEHGKGTWRLINDILSANEQRHFERWGCHFNRDLDADITDLVEKENLSVIYRRRFHFGTTLAVVLQKPPGVR